MPTLSKTFDDIQSRVINATSRVVPMHRQIQGLKLLMSAKKKAFGPNDFADWRRGSYEDPKAKASWGMVNYLLQAQHAEFPKLLIAFRDHRDRENRVSTGNGEWERNRGYEIAVEKQTEMMTERFGKTLFKDAQKAFENGFDED